MKQFICVYGDEAMALMVKPADGTGVNNYLSAKGVNKSLLSLKRDIEEGIKDSPQELNALFEKHFWRIGGGRLSHEKERA